MCVTLVIEYRVAMTIVMTVMDGAEVERESLLLTSSVINNVTGLAIYSTPLDSGFSYIYRVGNQERKRIGHCGYTTVNRTDISR